MKAHDLSAMLVVALSFTSTAIFAEPGEERVEKRGVNREIIQGDNTKLNRNTNQLTAADQGNSEKDTDTTAKIRSSVVSDDSLSTYAHNVKIITNEGQVVLRGPVRSEQERKIIVAKAKTIAGATHVKDDLTVVKQ